MVKDSKKYPATGGVAFAQFDNGKPLSDRPTVSPRARENADRQTDCLNGQHCLTVTDWFSYCDWSATVSRLTFIGSRACAT